MINKKFHISSPLIHCICKKRQNFHCICKNRQREHYVVHNWIPAQTLVMHMTFHWENLNSFTYVNIGATI